MAEYAGMPKKEHEKLTKAVEMYSRLTGESVDVGSIPVMPDADDPAAKEAMEAKAKQAETDLEAQAKAQQRKEEADKEARLIAVKIAKGEPLDAEEKPVEAPEHARQRAERGGSRKSSDSLSVGG